jgi:hypothetical protein
VTIALLVGLGSLAAGLLTEGLAALLAGSWYSAQEPWVGVGMTLIVSGLALAGPSALLLDTLEPLGWVRVVAIPPSIVLAFFWWFYLALGLPVTGPSGALTDIWYILYSLPKCSPCSSSSP